MTKLILIMTLILTGCYYPLTDEQQIEAVKKCEDAGYGVSIYKAWWDDATIRTDDLQCA